MKPPARYRAYVPTADLHVWLRTWDLDDSRPPRPASGTKPAMTPICWRHAHDPKAYPLGWERVGAGRVWQ